MLGGTSAGGLFGLADGAGYSPGKPRNPFAATYDSPSPAAGSTSGVDVPTVQGTFWGAAGAAQSTGNFSSMFGPGGSIWGGGAGGGSAFGGLGKKQAGDDSDDATDNEANQAEVAIERGSGIVQLEHVDVATGEEGEKTVQELKGARLFEYCKGENASDPGTWKAMGAGTLRLNSLAGSGGKSRLVMRRDGNFEVILNSLLFAGMTCNKGGDKGVLFAGTREGELVSYLVKVGTKADADKLKTNIEDLASGD